MRPLRLEMTAIGPFLEKTTIDFDRFGHGDLFLIHGRTGSGKSFIFDAICYALFGETPSHRDGNMKSDHAPDDVEPSIVFSFALGDKFYKVVRTLEYRRASRKKTAKGYVDEKETVQLVKLSSWPEGDEETLATKKSEVKNRCEELLGLKANQFSQVVLLPQGEFRKLLLASTKDREDLLEKLFDARVFGDIGNRLSEMRQEKEESVKNDLGKREALLEQHRSDIPDDLIDDDQQPTVEMLEIAKVRLSEALIELDEAVTESSEARKEATRKLSEAENLQKLFDDLEKKTVEAEGLALEKKEKIEPLEKEKRADEAAAKIWPPIESLEQKKNEVEEGKAGLVDLKDAETKATARKKEAGENAEQIPELDKKVTGLTSLIAQLEPLVDAACKLDEQIRAHADIESKRKKQQQVVDKLKGSIKENKKAIEEADGEIKDIDEDTPDPGRAEVALNDAGQFFDLLKKLEALAEQKRALGEKFVKADTARKTCNEKLVSLRERREAGLSGELAETLEDGAPCPVCGSNEHPTPATRGDQEASLETIREAEDAWKKADRKVSGLVAKVKSCETSSDEVAERREEFEKKYPDWPVEDSDKFAPVLQAAKEETKKQARRVKRLGDLRKKLEKLRGEERDKTDESEKARTDLIEMDSDHKVLSTKISEKEERWREIVSEDDEAVMPQGKTRSERLEKWIETSRKDSSNIADQIKKLAKKKEDTKTAQTAATARVESAQKQVEALLGSVKELDVACGQAIEGSRFEDAEEVKKAHRDDTWRTKTQKTLEEFSKRRDGNDALLRDLGAKLKDKEQPDLDAISKKRDEKEKENLDTIGRQKETSQQHKSIKKTIGAVGKIDRRCGELQKELGVLGKLDDQVRGQGQPKISLKRFFLKQRLEEVLVQASLRLTRLSSGQFTLKREEEVRRASSATGLDLNIHDSHTGTDRPASTLSGGQMFLASLSLALGLADVVQSRSGGTSIETLFIDEGFGSLDEETLQKALRVLGELRSGRMVGVISHITELKMQIQSRIEVTDAKVGSTIRMTVID